MLSRNRNIFAVSSLVLNLFASKIGEFYLPHPLQVQTKYIVIQKFNFVAFITTNFSYNFAGVPGQQLRAAVVHLVSKYVSFFSRNSCFIESFHLRTVLSCKCALYPEDVPTVSQGSTCNLRNNNI